MKIKNLFGKGRPVFSFEFFPPKTEEAEGQLFGAIEKLKPLKPTFISVMWQKRFVSFTDAGLN